MNSYIYTLPLIAAAGVSTWVAIYAFTHRQASGGAFSLGLLASATTFWTISYALEIASPSLPGKLFWASLEYIAIATIPWFWLIFALNYTNQARRVPHHQIAALAVLPLVTILLAFTYRSHGLIWAHTGLISESGFTALDVVYGPWFWVHSVYSYGLLLAGSWIIIRSLGHMPGLYRGQVVALTMAVAIPWISNILYLSGRSPISHLDLTPFAFTFSAAALAWGIFAYQLVGMAPFARNSVVEGMQDGVIVLNTQARVVDANPAAVRLIGRQVSEIIGQPAEAVFSRWPEQFERFRDVPEASEEVSFGEGLAQRWYELRLSPLHDGRGRTIGRIIILREITVRKKSQEQVRQLSRAVEASPLSIVITDTQGRIQYVNPRFTQVTGYTSAEVIGQNPRILKTEYTPPEVYTSMWQALAAGQEWQGEFCNRKKNGELYWESASISPIPNSEGQITHYVAVKEDITGQRQVREQLRRQNETLSILHQTTLDLLHRQDRDSLLQAIVDRACRLLDAPFGELMLLEEEELVTCAFSANQPYLTGDRVTRNQARLSWQAFDSCNPIVIDDYSAWPGHRAIYDENQMRAVAEFPISVGGQCLGILAMGRSQPGYPFSPEQVQDGVLFAHIAALVLDNASLYASALQEIAERKRAEDDLAASEARFRQIVETASDLIYRADVTGRFTYVNPTVVRLLGHASEASLVGRRYTELAPEGWRQRIARFYLRQIIRRTPNTYFEFPVLTAAGQEIWIGQNVQIILDGDQVIGFQAVARDITERKLAEETLALARDQALEASRLKSQLLAKVSHELRTPLSSILGYTELLRHKALGELSEQQQEVSDRIIDSANYLNNLINDLLDRAQIEARTVLLRREPFSPETLLQRASASLAILAENKGLRFTTAIDTALPARLIGDERRLQQIIINLAGNAIKFTTDGEVRVSLLRPKPDFWAIQIADTGAGIPPEAQSYIFEPFRQVDNAITRENRGAGLGLSITQQLVQLMEGQIVLESEVGTGSVFTVLLPLVEAGANAGG